MSQDSKKSSSPGGDELLFASELQEELKPKVCRGTWKLLVVDDEAEVHNVTRMVLGDLVFENRSLEFLNAYSGEEARELLKAHDDIAVILLDVVMETNQAGLGLVRYIRGELGNGLIRIILRTGQPGQAPERDVITDYDINDYKHKTELTSQKLMTTVISAIRSYRDLRIIDRSREGLRQIVESSVGLFKLQSIKGFTEGVLTQLTSLLGLDESAVFLQGSGFLAIREQEDFHIVAATGTYDKCQGKNMDCDGEMGLEEQTAIRKALERQESVLLDGAYVGYFKTSNGSENVLYLKGCNSNLSDLDKDMIRIFSTNVGIALDNIFLAQEIADTQREVVFTLGEVVENRSKETANHVRRVAEYSYLMALKAGMGHEEADCLRLASPLHDVGKIGIPDAILLKPGRVTPDEFEIIKTHTNIGYDILKGSGRKILKAAATVALQHHERWDGNGYPTGLQGEDIHIYGRITCLMDVFDALSCKRVYKDAWVMGRVLDYLRDEKGGHFDPQLVDLFLANMDEFLAIKERYSDE